MASPHFGAPPNLGGSFCVPSALELMARPQTPDRQLSRASLFPKEFSNPSNPTTDQAMLGAPAAFWRDPPPELS